MQHILEHPVFWDFQFTNHHEIFFPGQNSVGGTGSGAIVGMAVSLRDRLNIHRLGDPFPTPRKKHAIFLSNVTVCQCVCQVNLLMLGINCGWVCWGQSTFTFKCLSYFSLRFVHKGWGSLGPIHFWVLSRKNFGTKLAPYVYTPTKQPYISKKNIKKCFVSKWRPKNEFSFRENSHVTELRKTTFPKEFFNKIWLKVKDQAYIYIWWLHFIWSHLGFGGSCEYLQKQICTKIVEFFTF